jgi:hypothetical protein
MKMSLQKPQEHPNLQGLQVELLTSAGGWFLTSIPLSMEHSTEGLGSTLYHLLQEVVWYDGYPWKEQKAVKEIFVHQTRNVS